MKRRKRRTREIVSWEQRTVQKWTGDSGQDSGFWIMHNEEETVDRGQGTVDSGQCTVNVGRWTFEGGRWTVHGGQLTVDGGRVNSAWTVDS
jgi:hypothetical protein